MWPGKLRHNEEKFKQREQDLVVLVWLCCFGDLSQKKGKWEVVQFRKHSIGDQRSGVKTALEDEGPATARACQRRDY